MKILIVMTTGRAGPHVMRDLSDSFRNAGHVVDTLDYRAIDGETQAKRFVNLVKTSVDKLNSFIPDMVVGYGANACIVYADNDNNYIDLFTSLGIPTVCVFYDSPLEESIFNNINTVNNPKLHYYLVWDRHYAQEMKKLGFDNVHYMPIGTNAERFVKVEYNESDAREFGADVSFVGSRTPKRERMLSSLAHFDLAVWGYDWDKAKDEKLKKCARRVADNETELAKIYNYSKININITVDQGINSLNMRVFDCIASGGFLISDYKEDFDTLFGPGETATFKSLKELPEMVRYYLENEEERKEIAEKGRKRVLAEHDYPNRVDYIVDLLKRDGMFEKPRWWEGMIMKQKMGAPVGATQGAAE